MTPRRQRNRGKTVRSVPDVAPSPWLRALSFTMMAVFMAGAAMVRLRLAGVPLERDEGEYAYAGQLILDRIPPYQLAYNMKFPGTYYAYSLVMAAFGHSVWGIHVGLLVVNAATAIVLFLIGRRILGEFSGAVAASAFAVLSLDRWIMGVWAHATHFVLLPAALGCYVMLRDADSRRKIPLVAAGALLGAAVLMKQQAVFLLAFGIVFVVLRNLRRQSGWRPALGRGLLTGAGAALPLAVLCGVFAAQGVLQRFWFWTFQDARAYVSEIPLSAAKELFGIAWNEITQANLPLWVLAGCGAVLLWLRRWPPETRLFIAGLTVASFLAVCPGFYFREHYFILMLPAAALCIGVAAGSIEGWLQNLAPAAVARLVAAAAFVVVAGMYVSNEQAYLFTTDVREISRTRYGANPFIEAPEIARYIKERTEPADRIAVIGSEPEIYFYAERKSATGYIYTYSLMEPQPYASRMQHEMIQELNAAHPKFIVFAAVATSWLTRPASDTTILQWAQRYTDACYDVVGAADIYSPAKTAFFWDKDLASFKPRSENIVYTFRRKGDAPCAVEP